LTRKFGKIKFGKMETNMNKKWLAFGMAALFASAGIAISVDASAQNRPAAKAKAGKTTAKRAPAKKSTKRAVVRPVPPPPVVVPPIVIAPGGNTVGAHAAMYAAYANDVDSLAVSSVLSGSALTTNTEKIARHLNSDRLALGIVAYGAAYAATNEQFVAEARKAAAYFGRDAFIAKLRREYSYARVLPGGEEAAQLAARAVLADAAKLQSEGDDFKQAAYDWQALAWGKQSTADAAARNAALRALVSPPPVAEMTLKLSVLPDTATIPAPAPTTPTATKIATPAAAVPAAPSLSPATQARLATLATTSRIATPLNRTEIVLAEPIRAWSPVDRMVSLAALMAIGAPIDKQADTEALMRDPRLVSCVNSARLNMQMCNAATKQPYERSFCLAEHPLGEIAKCMAKVVR
jgi:hypothetical protein